MLVRKLALCPPGRRSAHPSRMSSIPAGIEAASRRAVAKRSPSSESPGISERCADAPAPREGPVRFTRGVGEFASANFTVGDFHGPPWRGRARTYLARARPAPWRRPSRSDGPAGLLERARVARWKITTGRAFYLPTLVLLCFGCVATVPAGTNAGAAGLVRRPCGWPRGGARRHCVPITALISGGEGACRGEAARSREHASVHAHERSRAGLRSCE